MFSELTEKTFDVFKSYLGSDIKSPLLIAVPSKRNFGISLCARILKSAWISDLSTNNTVLRAGDDLRITIPPGMMGNKNNRHLYTRVIKIENDYVIVSDMNRGNYFSYKCEIDWFSENVEVIHSSITPGYTQPKMLIGWINFIRKVKGQKNIFSDFLGMHQHVSVTRLKSKCYLIPGRHQVNNTREYLEKTELNQKVRLDQNLFVRENLDLLIKQFNLNAVNLETVKLFRGTFNNIYDYELAYLFGQDEIMTETINQLHNAVNADEFDVQKVSYHLEKTKQFLLPDHVDLYERLNNALHLPVSHVDTIDFDCVKAIVIERIDLLIRYPNVIMNLLNRKIPIVVLFDYENFRKSEREAFRTYQVLFPTSYTFNWDRLKLNSIFHNHNPVINDKDIDHEAHALCHRFLAQKIEIVSCNDGTGIIDRFFEGVEVRGLLREIEGFEGLKSGYVRHLRAILYWIKNSPGHLTISDKPKISKQLDEFINHYHAIRHLLEVNQGELTGLFDQLIELMNEEKIINTKHIQEGETNVVYFNQIPDDWDGGDLTSPENINANPNDFLVFTGTPLSEIKYRHLSYSTYGKFQNIRFLGFCTESEKFNSTIIQPTERFNESIVDNLPHGYDVFWDNKAELSQRICFTTKDCTIGFISTPPTGDGIDTDSINYENNQGDLDFKFKYTEAPRNTGDDREIMKPVTLIELEGNQILLLPKDRDMGVNVSPDGKSILSAYFDEILVGHHLFTYQLNRSQNIEMREGEQQNNHMYEDLDIWYVRLKAMFHGQGSNLQTLSNILYEEKITHDIIHANPSVSNLRNWLNEARLINAPENPNLKLIIVASGDQEWEKTFHSIRNAERRVLEMDRKNRESIRNALVRRIRANGLQRFGEINLFVNGVAINVKYGTVRYKIKESGIMVEQSKIGYIQKHS